MVTAAAPLGLLYHLADVLLYAGRAALKRPRWLLVSLVLIHLAFTPGAPLFPGLFSVPTLQGIEDGLLRAALLVLLMLAAHLLMQSTAREALRAALLWFSAPLAREIPACGASPLRQWCYLLLAGSLFWELGTI